MLTAKECLDILLDLVCLPLKDLDTDYGEEIRTLERAVAEYDLVHKQGEKNDTRASSYE